MIPLYRMEEHNEAYYCWHLAVEEKAIPPKGNLLLHVDHHDDLEYGSYDHDFSQPITTAAQAQKMVEDVLGIADFIIPAFWDGIFDEMVNFKSIFPVQGQAQQRVVVRTKGGALNFRAFMPLMDAGALDEPDPRYRFVTFQECSLMPLHPQKPVVLDIDLDYFCCDNTLSTGRPARVEITEQAYHEFVTDPHHPWRITARRLIRAVEENGRYYMEMRVPAPPPKISREERTMQRIEKFVNWLGENSITPACIDICRSTISGYCPQERCDGIEKELLNRLRGLYALELR